MNHKHKISTCLEFFSFSPAERWNKMEKGKLCYACLAPKDVCTTRKCNFEDKVPETLKCQGCAPWAQSKKLAPFSILFCRNKDHAKLRASLPDMKKDLEKYIHKNYYCSRFIYQVCCELHLSGILIEPWSS